MSDLGAYALFVTLLLVVLSPLARLLRECDYARDCPKEDEPSGPSMDGFARDPLFDHPYHRNRRSVRVYLTHAVRPK